MVGSDDEKEAEPSQSPQKRAMEKPPGNIVLKIFKQDDNGTYGLKPSPKAASKAVRKSSNKRMLQKTALCSLLMSKYADVADLILAIDNHKPNSLQEIWHSIRQRQVEDVGAGSLISSGECDFGGECEMPWLHPIIDDIVIHNESKVENAVQPNAVSKCVEKDDAPKEELAENLSAEVRFEDWRFGPAQFWYDMIGVPEDGDGFNFGFKLKKEESTMHGQKVNYFSDDAYLMVSQTRWEDDVIWNADNIRPEQLKAIRSKWYSSGWQPRPDSRIALFGGRHLLTDPHGRIFIPSKSLFMRTPLYSQIPEMQRSQDSPKDSAQKSIFPFENDELVYGIWENEIIWDAENMEKIPQPKVPSLDPSDTNVILGFPDDPDPTDQQLPDSNPVIKLCHPYKKNLKIVVGKSGVSCLTDDTDSCKINLDDPFNLSNDDYYSFKSSDSALRLKPIGGKLIQHSIPALELRQPFIHTYMGPVRLVNFHRPSLKRFSRGAVARNCRHPVFSLTKEIRRKEKERDQERVNSGGGDVYFMRSPEDLSARDGELALVEFSEEHPPLMNEVGMCSKFVNYYKRKASKDQGPPNLRYGEVAYAHSSPFLGSLTPGQCLQVMENNMYRCPLYEHEIPKTDFVVIRTRNEYSIREADALFVAGQQCPLYEVPAPNSRCSTNFARDFLQVSIYRMFWDCPDTPRWVKMDDIKKAFPNVSDLLIRKFLKQCSDFKRVDGKEYHCWVLRSDFRLPSEEELRSMISPEQCCAYFSMLAAEQRLKYAGYGDNIAFAPQNFDESDEDDEDVQARLDDEVKAAPWNTSRSFIQALSGKCLLQITGSADPTGCGEGFSYIRQPNRPGRKQTEEKANHSDHQKITLQSGREMLKKMGVPDKELKKLSSWELLDVVRTLSKKKVRSRRGHVKSQKPQRTTTVQHHTRYKEECQRVFDLQNRVLASNEVLSTDEEESSEDDQSDVEEMGKILEKLLSEGKTYSELHKENEEEERKELVKMMMGKDGNKQELEKPKQDKGKKVKRNTPLPGRILKINRTFRDPTGKEYTRVEFVRKSSVIDIYLKIRATKDESFIRRFAAPVDVIKEKRRLQGQLSRLKRQAGHSFVSGKPNMQVISAGAGCSQTCPDTEHNYHQEFNSQNHNSADPSSKWPLKSNFKADPKRKCKACGNVGHMRSSRLCPMYSGPVNVAMTQEEEEEFERQLNVDDQNLVNVDGTKLKLSVKLIKRAEEMKRRTLVLRVPKDIIRKRKRPISDAHCDYLEKHQRSVNRRRTDPVIVLSNIFESILNEMRDLPESDPFHFPVDAKRMPSYYQIISQPMDLQTMREKIRNRQYRSREKFLVDVNQIVENSALFNGLQSPFTLSARKVMNTCIDQMAEREDELMRLEESLNPQLDDHQNEVPLSTKTEVARSTPEYKVDQDLTISESEDELDPVHDRAVVDVIPCPVVP